MDYRLKAVIDGREIFEDYIDGVPSIAGVTLKQSTSLDGIGIGATASDSLYLTLINPYRPTFEGLRVDFYVTVPDEVDDRLQLIIDDVGDDADTTAVDTSDTSDTEEPEPGEAMTAQEIAEVEAEMKAETENAYKFLEGEPDDGTATSLPEITNWIQLGTFYVYSQKANTDGSVQLTCYDGFCKMNEQYVPTNKSASIQAIYNDLKAQCLANCGIELDAYEFEDLITLDWNGIYTTYRDAIGYLAGLVGGYATFGHDHTCGISLYGHSGTIILSNRVIEYKSNAVDLVVEGARCQRDLGGYTDDIIESGTGLMIGFQNPFMTKAMLDKVAAMYRGIRYTGAQMACYWSPELSSGEFIRYMTEFEYSNYLMLKNAIAETTDASELQFLKEQINSIGRILLVNNQTINFTGDAITKFDSLVITSSINASRIDPNTTKLKNLHVDQLSALSADMGEITAGMLQSRSGNFKINLTEESIKATNFEVDRWGNAKFHGDISGSTGEFAGSLKSETISVEGEKYTTHKDGSQTHSKISVSGDSNDMFDGFKVLAQEEEIQSTGVVTGSTVSGLNTNGSMSQLFATADSQTAKVVVAPNNVIVGYEYDPMAIFDSKPDVDINGANVRLNNHTLLAITSVTASKSITVSAGGAGGVDISIGNDTLLALGCTGVRVDGTGESGFTIYKWFTNTDKKSVHVTVKNTGSASRTVTITADILCYYA